MLMLTSGERLPVLVDQEGQPMFDPMVFALTEVRGRSLSTNTISMVLRCVMVFYHFLDAREINFDARLAHGESLTLGEIDDLARFCRSPLAELATQPKGNNATLPKIVSLEQARMHTRKALPPEVKPDVAANRLRYIRMYLQWLANDNLCRQGQDPVLTAKFVVLANRVSDAIDARITPNKSRRRGLGQREGLSDEARTELLRVIDPDSPDNPWREQHTRY